MHGVSVKRVAKQFGDHKVFEGVSLELSAGDKVALIGANGSGKSTLLRLMAGTERPDVGSVHTSGRVALLGQHAERVAGTVLEAVTPRELLTARAVLEKAQDRLTDPTSAHLEAFSLAEEHYRVLGGYDFEGRAAAVLAGLDLRAELSTAELSGGQGRRVMLAALLLSRAEVWLLDEPTNHLDTESLAWLEAWVRASPAATLVVSHDRAFLDATVTRVAELERGQLHEFRGNYSEAMAVKRTLREAQERQYEAQERKRTALTEEMQRRQSKARSANTYNPSRASDGDKLLAKGKAQNAQNVNASRAKALEKRLEQMCVLKKPYQERARVEVPLPGVPPGPSDVLRVERLGLTRGERVLFTDLSFTLRRGEKLALRGPNGSGKSSLIAALLGQLTPTTGSVVTGHGLSVYWAGQHGEELHGYRTQDEALRAAQPALRTQDLHHLLARLGLPPQPDFVLSGLSGGQHTRLSLARLAVTRASLLILDEPTNHLDLEAIGALEELLREYPGTVLFASHDRRLVEKVATGILTLPTGEVR
ncbi:ribosomal protection-like ABC-F family protein [Deinococcus peraridilitoris]|nr:ABC-F family ATP-binding cassette domain-containing protein [Deinococcus peraridilitoris]